MEFGIVRGYPLFQSLPRDALIHLQQKLLPAGLFSFGGMLRI
jgi:hypothetical protein